MRSWLLIGFLLLGCNDGTTPDVDGPCEWLTDQQGCPECAGGDVTCSYADQSVTEMSCGDCQAEVALMQALCDAGSTATAQEILDNRVCEDAGPE